MTAPSTTGSSDVWTDDIFEHEHYRRFRAVGEPGEGRGLRLCFLIGSADIGGGTYVIFQHALHAARQGADVTVVPLFPRTNLRSDWHPALQELTFKSAAEVADERFDVAVATWWRTFYELPKIRCSHAAYFVQSVESRFHATGPDTWASPVAERTYTFGLPVITIAGWLQAYLAFEHGQPSFVARNGLRKDVYHPFGPKLSARNRSGLRVLVEGPVDVPMKHVPESIALAREAGADEVWLLTSSAVAKVDGVDRVVSRVPIEQTSTIYRSCDVLLKLSQVEGMYGPPLEMFHCGGTVVSYDVTGHEEYVVHGRNGLVVPMGDETAVVGALRSLRDDAALLARLRHGALQTAASWPDWERSSERFWDIVRLISRQPVKVDSSVMRSIEVASKDLR